MVRQASLLACAGVLVAAALAGCLDARQTDYGVTATDGWYAEGFAYDGLGAMPWDGTVSIDVDDRSNTGLVLARGDLAGQLVEVRFDEFAPSKAFHDGGIRAGFEEHGDSGVGDTSIPRTYLDMAGWGTATFTRGGQPVVDPLSVSQRWAAHFMVVRDGVRDDERGEIHNADHSGPYDPMEPANASVTPGDWEVHLVVRSTLAGQGPPTQYLEFDPGGTVDGLMYEQTYAFEVNRTSVLARFVVNATMYIDAPDGTTDLTFTVRDGSGAPLHTLTVTPSYGELVSETFDLVLAQGSYALDVEGQGLQAAYNVDLHLLAEPPVMNFWWEEVSFA